MKLILFGGAELDRGHGPLLKELIKQAIVDIHPESVLHVPFARLHPHEEMFKEGWFKEVMADTGIKILDARVEADLKKANHSLVFINGGHGKQDLIQELNTNVQLATVIKNAKYIIAESAGSEIMGEYLRVDSCGEKIAKGLGILKNTIIEPHYSEKSREQLLINEMENFHIKNGIGIDCVTGIVVNPTKFPAKWNKVGYGNIDVKEC